MALLRADFLESLSPFDGEEVRGDKEREIEELCRSLMRHEVDTKEFCDRLAARMQNADVEIARLAERVAVLEQVIDYLAGGPQ